MITPKDIENKTMSPEKRKSAKNDYFAFYIGRPLSYILTIPFLHTNISPNTVSLISIIPIIVGFLLMCIGNTNAGGGDFQYYGFVYHGLFYFEFYGYGSFFKKYF